MYLRMPRTGKKTATKGKAPSKKPVILEDSTESSVEMPKKPAQKKIPKNTKKRVVESSSESEESTEESTVESSSESSSEKKPVKKMSKKATKKKVIEISEDSEESSTLESEEKPKKNLKKPLSKKNVKKSESSDSESREKTLKKKVGKEIPKKKEEDISGSDSEAEEEPLKKEKFDEKISKLASQVRENYLSAISQALMTQAPQLFLDMPFADFVSLVTAYVEKLKKSGDQGKAMELRKKFGVFVIGGKPEDQDPFFKNESARGVVKEAPPVAPLKPAKKIEEDLDTEEREKVIEDIEKNMEDEEEQEGTIEPIGSVERDLKKAEESISLSEKEITDLLTFSNNNLTDEELAKKAGVSIRKVYYFLNNIEKIKKENPRIMARLNSRKRFF